MSKPRRRVKRYAAMYEEALESRVRAEREAMLRDLADALRKMAADYAMFVEEEITNSPECEVAQGRKQIRDNAREALRRYDDSRR